MYVCIQGAMYIVINVCMQTFAYKYIYIYIYIYIHIYIFISMYVEKEKNCRANLCILVRLPIFVNNITSKLNKDDYCIFQMLNNR